MYIKKINSPLGMITLASDGEFLTGLWIEGQHAVFHDAEEKNLKLFELVEAWLTKYFHKQNPALTEIPIKLSGSPFQLKVWNLLKEIPYGQTTTYGHIASSIKLESHQKMSAQAVGQAVGHNPISIIIPCHRVIGKHGKLTGYSGGLDKKIFLLGLEESHL